MKAFDGKKEYHFSTMSCVSGQILLEVVSTMELAFTWGYRWRKPYSGMKNNEEVRTPMGQIDASSMILLLKECESIAITDRPFFDSINSWAVNITVLERSQLSLTLFNSVLRIYSSSSLIG